MKNRRKESMRKKTAGLAALICAAGLISVTQTDTVLADL